MSFETLANENPIQLFYNITQKESIKPCRVCKILTPKLLNDSELGDEDRENFTVPQVWMSYVL
jgi:hypothetical protein